MYVRIYFLYQSLMVSSPNLSKDANVIYRHNLTGSLESALRASNAELDDPDIFSRLDVRLLEVSPGDSGWEVFSLDYHVDGPLKTVFNKQAMHAYHRLFTFLWRLKRVEHVITLTWKQRIDCSHLRMDCQSLVHKYRLLWTEMTHFIYQLQYYILFEVGLLRCVVRHEFNVLKK